MNFTLRKEVEYILEKLTEAGFEAYLVGGAVRDLMLDYPVQDFDFTTNAKPEKIKDLFPDSYYQNEFGTVSLTHQELLSQIGLSPQDAGLKKKEATTSQKIIDLAQAGKIHHSLSESVTAAKTKTDENDEPEWQFFPDFEITTYRSDEVYEDFRRPDPEKLKWGQSIEEDLTRRDFTINAMALDLEQNLVDPFSGQKDLEQGLIRTVGQAEDRFEEDALRLLRAVRFSVQLGFKLEPETWQALKKQYQLLKHISAERIRDELFKMLLTPHSAQGIKILNAVGLLGQFLPELVATQGVEQGGHHTTGVWTHSLDALQECPSRDPIVKLATLLHDIGKPTTYKVRDGEITFYNHEVVSSRLADKIAQRLKFSKKQRRRLFTLVRHHMFYYQPFHTDAAIRRFMKRVGLENIDDILDLREGDRLGSGARKTSWRLEEMKERIIDQLHQPLEATDLAINGHDLMNEFKLEPGAWIGEVLERLLKMVIEEPELNTKEKLLTKSKEILKDKG